MGVFVCEHVCTGVCEHVCVSESELVCTCVCVCVGAGEAGDHYIQKLQWPPEDLKSLWALFPMFAPTPFSPEASSSQAIDQGEQAQELHSGLL